MDGCDKCSDGSTCDTCAGEKPFMVKDDNGKTTQCLLKCPDQYTHEEGSQVCIKCDEKCNGCNGAADKCVKCASTHLPLYNNEEAQILQDCVTGCGDGQYKKDGACYPCDSSCKTCASTKTCDTCKNTNEFINTEGKCEACDVKCATCSGTSTTCLTCASTHIPLYDNEETKTLQDCVSGCVDGQYEKDGACYPCDSSCKTCASTTTCDTCKNTNEFINTEGKCEACDVKCATCSGTSTTCLTCASGYKTIHDETSGTIECVKGCSPGFYEDGDECKPCDSSCKTCASIKTCDTCKNTNEFINAEGKCEACDVKCATCKSAADKCLTCASTHIPLFDNEEAKNIQDCVSGCVDGQYEKDGACYPCDSSCQTCSNTKKCDTCKNTNEFINAEGKCEACDVKCATCSGTSTTCLTCAPGYKTIHDETSGTIECVEGCSPGFYEDGDECKPCDSSCQTCLISATQCTSCAKGKILLENKCNDCNEKCAECEESVDKCKVCADGYKEVIDRSSVLVDCASKCPDGTFEDGSTCRPCDVSCQTCENADTCKTCQGGHFVGNSGKCEVCEDKCEECSGSANKCTSCKSSFKPLYEQEGSSSISDCVENCGEKQYAKGDACYLCDESCKTCTGSEACETCEDQQFINSGGKCEACDPKCASCSVTATSCTLCAAGFKPLYDKNSAITDCVASCPGGTFESEGETPSCIPCTPRHNCLLCTNAASCSACGTGEFSIPVYSSEDTPVFVCASSCDGYFTTEETPRCIGGCNPTLNCAVCRDHNSCESCPVGFFLDSASKCVICDATRNCATCNNSHSCSSCNNGSMKYFSDENERNEVNFEKCVSGDSCPDRSYVFEVDQVAVCVQTPTNCVDNNCATCRKGFKGGKCGEQCEKYEFCPEGSSASTRGNCSEGCYGCNNDDAANGRSQCISCLENHALVDGKCVPCGKNEKSELGNTSDKCEKDGLATWAISVIAVAAVVGVALVVGAGVGVSRCVSKAPANDLLFDDDGVPLKPLSKKSVQSGEAPADAFI